MAQKNIHGKKFESKVNEAFDSVMKKRPCYWARILDSASAGNLIEAREGDFEFTIPVDGIAMGFIVECKASTEHLSLASGFKKMLRPKQVAKMRLRLRGGFHGIYLFHSVNNDEIEVWSARPLIEAFHQKRERFFCQPCTVISASKLEILVNSWLDAPKEFLAKLIRSETVPVGVSDA